MTFHQIDRAEAVRHAQIFLAMVPAVLDNDNPPRIAHAHAAVVVRELLDVIARALSPTPNQEKIN